MRQHRSRRPILRFQLPYPFGKEVIYRIVAPLPSGTLSWTHVPPSNFAKRRGRSKMSVLQTTQLTLSPCCPSDGADFIDLELDPEVMRYLNGGHAVDHEHIDPNATFLMPRGTEPYVWTARRIANGAFVGWFCLWPESETLAELGYRLRRMDWGRGLASEGASALINWGF